jgi:hypothetical protein
VRIPKFCQEEMLVEIDVEEKNSGQDVLSKNPRSYLLKFLDEGVFPKEISKVQN